MSGMLRDESGMTLPDVLTVCAMMIFILGGTLAIFDVF